jgi:tetratricopeptide (TPR) repeat protein
VFISSTFRDMQGEREELVKRVFPEIRRLCEERGVTWGEVDLRWGVTDEQKAEGQVLPICLAEIELSRPYFIGLLGDRYGWVPDEIPGDLAAQQQWLGDVDGKSVTELEVLHGVLNDPDMAGHAYFYFRDPAFLDQVPEAERDAYLELPTAEEIEALGPEQAEVRAAARRQQLADLKDRIRSTTFPVRDDYADPRALGELVRADLLALVDRLYPPESVPDPLDRAAADNEAHAATRRGVYIGRSSDYATLDAEATGSGPPLAVTGESGAGKSALLANWAHRLRHSPGWESVPVIEHYVGASAESTDWSAMLRRLIGELARRAGATVDVPDDPDGLRVAFASALAQAGTGQRVVLVLDGLDQLEDRDGALDLAWLPLQLPPGVRLVVSTLAGRPLDEWRRRGWEVTVLDLLDADGRRELIRAFLAQYAKALGPELEARLAGAERAANPRYLRIVLDELRQHGDHFTLGEVTERYLGAATTDDLLEQVLARYETDFEADRPGLVRDAFTALWAARRGLAETELLDLLGPEGTGEPLPHRVWSPLFLAAGQALVVRSGLVGFAHDDLRRAVEDRYLTATSPPTFMPPSAPPSPPEADPASSTGHGPDSTVGRGAHERLAAYFAGRAAVGELGPRVVDELPWQQARAEQWDDLAATLGTAAFLDLAYRTDLLDLKRHWATLEAKSPHRMDAVYAPVLAAPAADDDASWAVARLLTDAGHVEPALGLHRALVDQARADGNQKRLQAALANLGAALLGRDELDAALAAFTEQEQLCRALGETNGLQVSLGNQGAVWRAKGDRDRALALMAEEERLCREAGDRAGVQASIANQGATLLDARDLDGAMARFVEQETISRQLGDPVLVAKAMANQASVLSTRGDLDGALARYAEQAEVSRGVGDIATLSVSLGNQASIHLQRGEYDRALELAVEEEQLCARTGSRAGLTRSLLVQATVRTQRGEFDDALALLDRHEAVARELGTDAQLAQCFGTRATILRDQGQHDAALGLHVEEERIYRELGDTSGVAASLGNQGLVRQAMGDNAGALALYDAQEQLLRQIGDPAGLQVCLGNRASVLLATGDVDQGVALLQEQERICRELGLTGGLAVCLGNQGIVRDALGDLAGALSFFQQQEQLCRQIGDQGGLATSLGNQAGVHVKSNNPQAALVLLEQQAAICREMGTLPALVNNLEIQTQVRMALGDLAGLQQVYAEQQRIADQVGDPVAAANALLGQGTMLLNSGQQAAALPLLEQAEAAGRVAGIHSVLQMALSNRGLALQQLGRNEEAMPLLAEAEQLCRGVNDLNGLQAVVGNQGIVLHALGRHEEAIAKLVEQEQLCQQTGNAGGMVIALANRGEVTSALPGRTQEALQLVAQARQLAVQYGMAPMVPQLDQLAQQIQQRG